jgi:hypothetical protein
MTSLFIIYRSYSIWSLANIPILVSKELGPDLQDLEKVGNFLRQHGGKLLQGVPWNADRMSLESGDKKTTISWAWD